MLAHHTEQIRQAAERTCPAAAPGYRPESLDVSFRASRGERRHVCLGIADALDRAEAGAREAARTVPHPSHLSDLGDRVLRSADGDPTGYSCASRAR
jgi:hypothetical protein